MTTKAKPENRHRLALRKVRTRLNRRRPEEWRAAVNEISDPALRARIAAIVRWDFFSLREIAKRWPHLDDLVKPFVRMSSAPRRSLRPRCGNSATTARSPAPGAQCE